VKLVPSGVWCAQQWVRYDRIIPGVHISDTLHARLIGSCTLGKDSHYPFLVLSTQYSFTSTLPRHPGSGLNRQGLISFPGVRYYPSSFTCFWTTGAGESYRPFAPSLSFGGFHLAGSPPLNHQCSGWASFNLNFTFFLYVLTIERVDLPFHHLFPTTSSLCRTNGSFVTTGD